MEDYEAVKKLKNDIRNILNTSERFLPHHEYLEQYKSYMIYQAHNQEEYFLDLNLAILKLYQIYPAQTNFSYIICILLKAMMQIPKKDFLLCKYLLTPAMLENENVVNVIKLNNLLENAEYTKFWELINLKKYLVEEIDGFENTIRAFILTIIGTTFKSVKKNYVLQQVDMRENDTSFENMINDMGWKQEFDDLIIGEPKSSKNKNISEKFDIETMKKLMPVLRTV